MADDDKIRAGYDLVYLAGCGINNIVPNRERIEKMNLKVVYNLSSSLSFASLTYMALESAYGGKLPDDHIFKIWEDERDFSLYRNLLFEAETDNVTAYLASNGIWYCPLKGIVLKDLYPQQGMREMCDVDILFDKGFAGKVHDWFIKRGYVSKEYQRSNVDSYLKEPVYNFEMHRYLFAPPQDVRWRDYYGNIKERLIRDSEKPFEFHLSDDDFYVYLLAHTCKHYRNRGTGLRSLLDVYVYLKAKGENLDREYTEGEFSKLGLCDFAEKTENCALKVFSDPMHFEISGLSEDEKEFLDSFLFTGTYGTTENMIKNKMSAIAPEEESPSVLTKLRYIKSRFFPDPEVAKMYYPFFDHKWQYPIGYFYRIISRAASNGKKVLNEFKLVKKL